MAFSHNDIVKVQRKRSIKNDNNNYVYSESITDKIKYIVLSRPVAYLVSCALVAAAFIIVINKAIGM